MCCVKNINIFECRYNIDIDIVSDHLLLHFLSGCLVEAHPMISQSIESTEIWACLIINFIQNKKN